MFTELVLKLPKQAQERLSHLQHAFEKEVMSQPSRREEYSRNSWRFIMDVSQFFFLAALTKNYKPEEKLFDRGDMVRIKEGWGEAGKTFTVLGKPLQSMDTIWWVPVHDNEASSYGDPTYQKLDSLEMYGIHLHTFLN